MSMKHRKLLSLLLVFAMLFSLTAFTAAAEEPAEDSEDLELVDVIDIEDDLLAVAPADEIDAIFIEDEPMDDPVVYDLWVCGVQVTDSNKNMIVAGVSFNPTTSTLSINGNAASSFTNPALHEGAVIYSELPDLIISSTTGMNMTSDTAEKLIYVKDGNLTVDCYMQITAPAADYAIFVSNGDLLLDKVTINYSSGPKDMVPVVLMYSAQNGVGITNGTISATSGTSNSTVTINGKRYGFSYW